MSWGARWQRGPAHLDDEDPHRNPAAAGKQLVEMLLELYMASQLSAEHLAVMCYWCDKAGMSHVSPFAKPPGKQSGQYAAHISSVLGFDLVKKHMFRLSLVGKGPGSAGRGMAAQPGQDGRSQGVGPIMPSHL